MPGRTRALRSWRWLRSRFRRGVVILGYHRVHGEEGPEPFGLSVSPQHFEEHLQVLSRRAHPITLTEAARALTNGEVTSRAVVVTFDDGYADNLHAALPLLERYAVPATVFVVSGTTGREFWWDALARIVAGMDDTRLQSCLAPAHPEVPERGARRHGTLDRQKLAAAIAASFEAIPEDEREARLRALAPDDSERCEARPQHRAMTREELRQLAASELVEVGAHGATHRALASLPLAEQEEEVGRSRRDLEAVTGCPVTSFAYPHGSLSRDTMAIVAAAGFTIGCSSRPEPASPRSELLALPRLWAPDQDGDHFERWLKRWLA